MTKLSSLGRWVPIYDEKWDGDLPPPHTDAEQALAEDTDCGEVVFKKDILPWRAGEYEVLFVSPCDLKNNCSEREGQI